MCRLVVFHSPITQRGVASSVPFANTWMVQAGPCCTACHWRSSPKLTNGSGEIDTDDFLFCFLFPLIFVAFVSKHRALLLASWQSLTIELTWLWRPALRTVWWKEVTHGWGRAYLKQRWNQDGSSAGDVPIGGKARWVRDWRSRAHQHTNTSLPA